MNIENVMIERLLELATKAGYKPSGNMLKDTQDELMLCRFAHLVAAELSDQPTCGAGNQKKGA